VLATIVTLWARRAVAYSIDLKYFVKVIAATTVMALCLRYLPVNGIFGIEMAIAAGAAISGSVLFLLRALSEQDRQTTRERVRQNFGYIRGTLNGFARKEKGTHYLLFIPSFK
jgi:hypothetical protein